MATVEQASNQPGAAAPDIDRQIKAADTDLAGIQDQQRVTREAADSRRKTMESDLQTQETAVRSAMSDLSNAAAHPPAQTPKPEVPSGPIIDAKQYEGLAYGLLAMGLIGGIAGNQRWNGVLSSLNGALEGYAKGAKENAQKDYQDYKLKFDAAVKYEDQANREFENVLRNKSMSINEQTTMLRILAQKYERFEALQAVNERNFAALQQSVEKRKDSLLQTKLKHEDMQDQLAQRREMAEEARADRAAARAEARASRGMQVVMTENGPMVLDPQSLPRFDPENPSNITGKIGGRAGSGSMNERFANRVLNAANEGAASLATIAGMKDPKTGVFSPGSGSIFSGGLANAAARTLSGQQVAQYNATMAGLANEIAFAQNGGTVPNESQVKHILEAITIQPTDNPTTAKYRIALAARYLKKGLESSTTLMTDNQRALAETRMKDLDQFPDPDQVLGIKKPASLPNQKQLESALPPGVVVEQVN